MAAAAAQRATVSTPARDNVDTSTRADGRRLSKVTLNLPTDLMDGLKRLALDEKVTVGALVEALTAAALSDDALLASVVPSAREITGERRARK